MKVGILTFHGSHNYGSMLQAYALQQTVIALGHDCRIINLRTPRQKKYYTPFYLQNGLRSKLIASAYPKIAFNDWRKHRLFERFLRNNLILTDTEYSSSEQLHQASLDFDVIISGSDQIWNTWCFDHEPAYFLDFNTSAKRVAYAPSMGPDPQRHINPSLFPLISKNLGNYDAIAVREQTTASMVSQILSDDKSVDIVLDPTLLLPSGHWSRLAGDTSLVSGDYIFVYTPWPDKELYAQASALADKTGMKVVCSSPHFYHQWHRNPHFHFHTAVGPIEFLNLVKFSSFVVCSSFHAVVFSVLFSKPFYAHKGMSDGRIATLLSALSLEHCVQLPDKFLPGKDLVYNIDSLTLQRAHSLEFLKNSLA